MMLQGVAGHMRRPSRPAMHTHVCLPARAQAEGDALQLPLMLRCIEQGADLFSGIEPDLLRRDAAA